MDLKGFLRQVGILFVLLIAFDLLLAFFDISPTPLGDLGLPMYLLTTFIVAFLFELIWLLLTITFRKVVDIAH